MSSPTLQVQLESELPAEVHVGRGTALFVCGWCFSPQAPVHDVEFLVDGIPQPVMAHGMPRLDPFRMLHPDIDPYASEGLDRDPGSPEDPLLLSYRSGFWGIVRIDGPRPEAELTLSLRARLEGGQEAQADLGRLVCATLPEPATVSWPDGASGAPVAVAMATFNPPQALLKPQIDTIKAQTHGNWVCVISDDCSSPERFAGIRATVGDDPRFVVSRSPRRLGFYRNFERALALVPKDAQYVALADQDDSWHPDKLEVLLDEIGDAQLAYSDARIVSRDGALISETWWNVRRNNHSSLLSLLVANAVTGAASLLRRDLLERTLPFPPAQFAHFHDHWIGLSALALGEIKFVDRALYDYVQHGDASLGHAAANEMSSLRDRIRDQRALPERVRMWRLHYFVDVCRLMQFATVLDMRDGDRMTGRKRRELRRFLRTDQSLLSVAQLALRGVRELVGKPETLGAEWMLFHAFAWRRLLSATTRDRPHGRLRLDALPPRTLVMEPGKKALHPTAGAIADKIAPLRWTVSDDAPARINLLIPTIDLQHFFGGYIAKFNLAQRLLDRGLRVRIVTVDPVGPLPGEWKQTLESYSGLGGLFDRVEVVFGRESAGIEVSRADNFIATTWWTAHIAHQASQALESGPFLYLIQEYEPFTFPMGTFAALAGESYGFPHFALFSSELLRGYFRAHGIGVYASGTASGDAASAAFQNAITPVRSPTIEELARRESRKLLFYARPEPHAARNMFELGVLALSRALEEGVFEGGWDLHGIGTVDRGKRIDLGGGALELIPRSDQSSYADLLREHDVGLALMYTPHPSLVPIEMASAGMLTVTNSFENKTAAALTAISSNLITAEPTVESVTASLRAAAEGVTDVERRVRGSDVAWTTKWEASFGPELLDRVVSGLLRLDAAAV